MRKQGDLIKHISILKSWFKNGVKPKIYKFANLIISIVLNFNQAYLNQNNIEVYRKLELLMIKFQNANKILFTLTAGNPIGC